MFTQKEIKNQTWKDSIVDSLILPNIGPSTKVLEIGCNKGDWTQYFRDALEITASDENPNNINFCIQNLNLPNCHFHHINNSSLSFVPNESIDFIWSFDTFTKLSSEQTLSYLHEIARVLKPNGICFIHHPGYNNLKLILKRVFSLNAFYQKIFQFIYSNTKKPASIKQSKTSPQIFSSLVLQANLIVEAHIFRWGKYKQFSVKPDNGCISIITHNSKLLNLKNNFR